MRQSEKKRLKKCRFDAYLSSIRRSPSMLGSYSDTSNYGRWGLHDEQKGNILVKLCMDKNRWWLAIPFALGVMIVNVLISILYVIVYSYLIDPGHDEAYYQAHAQVAAPYSSILAGIPLMFLAGRWLGGKFPKGNSVKAALLMWLVYFILDFAIITAAGALAQIAVLFIISFVTKLGAAFIGGISAQNRGAYLRR